MTMFFIAASPATSAADTDYFIERSQKWSNHTEAAPKLENTLKSGPLKMLDKHAMRVEMNKYIKTLRKTENEKAKYQGRPIRERGNE